MTEHDEPADLAAPEPMRDQILRYARGDMQQIGVDDVATLQIEVSAITHIDGEATALLVVRAAPTPQIDVAGILQSIRGISWSMAYQAEAMLVDAREAALAGPEDDDE